MASSYDSNTIRILVATDNHVGYAERDAIRGDDSWKTFHEIMGLAKQRDVDMVLLAGDLFHENKPSRKAMYQVMRSLRMNCLGDKPCPLQMLSDASEVFQGAFNHANYEDMDVNVAIPVFSIHGNHDDPSGEGHLAALDILQVSGLINYYGRTREADKIEVKPVLLQKGNTKLALYGLSNVRDERLYRTFKEKGVKFFAADTQRSDWFNILSVHQNHHAYTETGYLPEDVLPDFLDLVIWGHEHECLIDPTLNPNTNFHVMQPGSSIATSLMPGEAKPKHVAILSVTGRNFETENIRLKTVRPFVMEEIVLAQDKKACKIAKSAGERGRIELTRYLESIVDGLIAKAEEEWEKAQEEARETSSQDSTLHDEEPGPMPLPIIRLRVETTSPPEGGTFDTENPQRFSNRFVKRVANVSDVVQFYRKKKTTSSTRSGTAMANNAILSDHLALDSVKVERLVREFLTAQSLTILPQNSFGDAVSQFVDKDDKHAMEMFVNESLANQIKHLMALDGAADDDDENEEIQAAMNECRARLEQLFASGSIRRSAKRKFKPKPDDWDSDMDGEWEDQPGALIHTDAEDFDDKDEDENDATPMPPPSAPSTRGRGRGRGGRGGRATATAPTTITTTSTRGSRAGASSSSRSTAATARTPGGPKTSTTSRARKKPLQFSSDDLSEADAAADAMAVVDSNGDQEEEEESQGLFVRQSPSPPRTKRTTRATASPAKKPSSRAAAKMKQSTLSFGSQSQNSLFQSQSQSQSQARRKVEDISDDDDDDDDAFEPAPRVSSIRGRGRR